MNAGGKNFLSNEMLRMPTAPSAADWTPHDLWFTGKIINLSAVAAANGVENRGDENLTLQFLLRQCTLVKLLAELQGTFAFAWYDRAQGRLLLVRDRFGFLPLLYRQDSRGVHWADSVTALVAADWTLDPRGLSESVHYRWLVGVRTLVEGINQVPAASYVWASAGRIEGPQLYWRFVSAPDSSISHAELVQLTQKSLHQSLSAYRDSYQRPVVLLSGGVDSSLLAAYARDHFEGLCAVTVDVEGWTNPETPRARAVAKQLGIPLEVVSLTAGEVQPLFDRMNKLLEEPSRHYSSISLLRAVDAIPEYCDAVIYGEAADTLFGSWAVVNYAQWMKRYVFTQRLPAFVRSLLGAVTSGVGNKRAQHLNELVTRSPQQMLNAISKVEYRLDPTRVFRIHPEPTPDEATIDLYSNNNLSPYHLAQERLLSTTVVNHVVYLDRMIKQRGLSIICPFVDQPVLEVAKRVPASAVLKDGNIKPILKELASQHCDRELMYARKFGFESPAAHWTRQLVGAKPAGMRTHPRLTPWVADEAEELVIGSGCVSLQWTWLSLQCVLSEFESHAKRAESTR